MKIGKGNEPPLKKREISDDYELVLSNESTDSADQENKIASEFKKQEHEDYVEVSEAMPKVDFKRREPQIKKKMETMSLMDYLFAFIHVNDQLNPVLSGYFSKLVLALFKKNSTKVSPKNLFNNRWSNMCIRILPTCTAWSIIWVTGPWLSCFQCFLLMKPSILRREGSRSLRSSLRSSARYSSI
jgi:hypothetical protein